MANIKLKQLLETAVERKPLKEINFGSQNAFDDYIKQHDLRPDTKVTIRGKAMTVAQARKNSSEPTVNTKPNDMFGGDYAKDRGGEAPKADVKSIVKGILKTADKEFRGVHKLKDIVDDIEIDSSDADGKELQSRIDKGEEGTYVQTDETEGTVVFNDGSQYKFSHVEDGPIPVTKVRPQSKVQDFVKNLSGKQYKEFAFDNDIDHRDPMEMQDFIQSLSDEEAEEILKKYGKNESTKLTSMIKR